MNEYEWLRNDEWVGFAEVYLNRCHEESERYQIDIQIDNEIYNKLTQLDTTLGTTASEQLRQCLLLTTRWDIIKVRME